MATEERITEVETPTGNTHTSHTVVDRDTRSGAGWLIPLLLVLALLVGGYFLMRNSDSEASKDNAVAAAAERRRRRRADAAAAVENAADNVTETK
jgi:hypothetical protein